MNEATHVMLEDLKKTLETCFAHQNPIAFTYNIAANLTFQPDATFRCDMHIGAITSSFGDIVTYDAVPAEAVAKGLVLCAERLRKQIEQSRTKT